MDRLVKKSVLFFIVALLAPVFILSMAQAQEEGLVVSPPRVGTAAQTMAYWTPERMAAAEPYPMPVVDASLGEQSTEFTATPVGEPGFVNGTLPVRYGGSSTESEAAWVGDEPQWGGPPGNWQTSYPGPFQRWTWFGAYLTYPTSTIGKLFFTQNAVNYVCSASVINAGGPQHDVIATAGHCVSDGAGSWSYNLLFCPSYNKAGVNPARGCWPYVSAMTFAAWYYVGNIEADVGCMVAANTGTIINDHVGNVTGTLGRAWNWGWDEPEFSFGYPAASPFPGYHIIAVAGPEWYTVDWQGLDWDGSPLIDSKYMGNDMTGGCSGGPWILGWGHKTYEYPDTDGSNATDPLPQGQGWLNGVNSHKIIVGGVTRTQEMGSAQFTNTHPDTETLWGACQVMANGD
jgi:hypothetical protein